MEIQNLLNQLRFEGRRRLWGSLRFRKGLPTVQRAFSEEAFYSLILHRGLPKEFQCVLDIGCRNWSYVAALAKFFPEAQILGIEVDGFKRYRNLFRRIDYACAYAKVAQENTSRNTQSVARSITALPVNFFDFFELPAMPPESGNILFCFFFPFVSQDPCLAWGLPKTFSHFAPLIQHALTLGQRAGKGIYFLSLHQGEWEAEIARNTYRSLGVDIISEQKIQVSEFQDLWPGRYELWLMLCTSH